MKRRLAPWLVTATLLGTAVACSSSDGSAGEASPSTTTRPRTTTTGAEGGAQPKPTTERIELETVPLPDQVVGLSSPNWTADGKRLIFSLPDPTTGRTEISEIGIDGSGLTCLTCGVAPEEQEPLLKPITFDDGKRILVRVGEQGPADPARHAIVECEPSVVQCTSARLLPIQVPAADDPNVEQDQREFRIAPDSTTVGFTQVRRSADDPTEMVAVVGRLRRADDHYEVDDPRVVSTLGELKNFTPDGKSALIAAFTTLPDQVANPDIVRVDLATGKQEQVTHAEGYDEDISFAPDMQSYAVMSGRSTGLYETVSQVRRPAFVGPGLEALTGYLFVGHRKELLEPWIVPVGAEAEGQMGQRVNPDSPAEGYDARVLLNWNPTGDALVFWEAKGDPFQPTKSDTRVVIARLPDREPVEPPAEAPTSPRPTWGDRLEGYVPPATPQLKSRKGRKAGSVTVTRRPAPGRPGEEEITATYDGFTDDGEWVIDGTEQTTSGGGLLSRSHYVADLELSGDHTGYLRADATFGASGFEGSIESSVDGRVLRLPTDGSN